MTDSSSSRRRRSVDGSSNPTMPARQLAKELKRLRDASGKTQVQVAKYVGCPSTTISKFETSERNVPEPHLKLMLQCYDVELNSAYAVTLMELAKQAREPGWWRKKHFSIPEWFDEYLGLETAANVVETYESEYVPGLLQTLRYIESISTAGLPNNSEGAAAVRAARQQRLLTTDDAPLTLRTILNEAVLLRPIGSPEIMREQLASLRDAARNNPNVMLRVLPFSAGAHPGMTGPFTILRFSEAADMDVVFIELRGDASYRDRPEDLHEYTEVFGRISDLALSEADTVSLLAEIERKY